MTELFQRLFFEIWLIIAFLAAVAFETVWHLAIIGLFLGAIFFCFSAVSNYRKKTGWVLWSAIATLSAGSIVGSLVAAFVSFTMRDIPSLIVFSALVLFFIGVLRHLLRPLYEARASAEDN